MSLSISPCDVRRQEGERTPFLGGKRLRRRGRDRVLNQSFVGKSETYTLNG